MSRGVGRGAEGGDLRVVRGGVTRPRGFVAHGLWCGVKRSGRPDLSLIVSRVPASAAGIYTRNSVKAAPLIVSRRHLRRGRARAIVTNSGNANCFTGAFGLAYAERTARRIADLLDIPVEEVVVASTGIIGKPLPIRKILKACPDLVEGLSPSGGEAAARGIMTTDTFPKEAAVRCEIGGRRVTVGACAKGSGMIEPHMATMLAFITTDASVAPSVLRTALREAAATTFNRITVDGCMSTNDMVVVLANGMAGHRRIERVGGGDYRIFVAALQAVCLDLAKKIVEDGEGATKFITVEVRGAASEKEAERIARAVADSNLVKTAAYGCNPNWGRVAAAVGSVGLPISEEDMRIRFSSFKGRKIRILVECSRGPHRAVVYTSDLSVKYVKINGRYN